MPGKVWKPSQSKQFARSVVLGKPYYTINSHARNLGAYEDENTYSVTVFTSRSVITGSPMSGSESAAGLCLRHGPVHEQPPVGVRPIAGPAPQVGGPLPDNYEGILDPAELRGLDKRNSQSLPPNVRRALNARRP
ncbi:hypothetical protein ACWCRC_38920 [Streptomyces sp. NPDC001940]|uniref:hypothetical protein n=1 Tax=Streptomyces sp. NPDC056105 TaxID=3345714 RepID=UPI0035D53537